MLIILLISLFSTTFADLEDADLTSIQLIDKYGYTGETHYCTTEDGYILNMVRIPTAKNGTSNNKVVLWGHGLSGSSDGAVLRENAIGYILANHGFDVWIGNYRGNIYSRNHTTLNPDSDKEFWNFSMTEMALYDLPCMVDLIKNKTGKDKIYYAGHSEGTTCLYILCSEKPEYNDRFISTVSMAPVVYVSNIKNLLLKGLALVVSNYWLLDDFFCYFEFTKRSEQHNAIVKQFCKEGDLTQPLCAEYQYFMYGRTPDQMNKTLLPVQMSHAPSGASFKNFVHFADWITYGIFRHFNNGPIENFKAYGQLTPPKFNLKNFRTKNYLFYSDKDTLSDAADVEKLYNEVSKTFSGMHKVFYPGLNHFDWQFGLSSSNIYEKIATVYFA